MRSRPLKLLAVSVLLVAGILRFSALGRQGAWDDESFTLRALGIIPEPMTMAEGAPPLYFLSLRSWVAMAGTSLAAVRAFSALWGAIGVGLMGFLAGRLISPQAGLFSAAVLGLHPFHLAYSQEARPYALVFALATATIWMAWERRLWLFVLVSTALLWTHPWGVFVWLASAALLVIPAANGGQLFGRLPLQEEGRVPHPPLNKGGLKGSVHICCHHWLLSLLPLVLAAPALWHFTRLSLFGSFWAKPPDLGFLVSVVEALGGGAFYVGGWQFNPAWPGRLLCMTFILLWVVGLLREDARHTRRKLLLALVALFLVPSVAGWLAPEASAHQRYWLAALPLTLLLAARGWERLPSPFRTAVSIVCLAGLLGSNVYYFTSWQKGNVLQAVQKVEAQATPVTVVILPKYLQPLWKYYSRTRLSLIDEEGIDRLAPIIRKHTQAIMVTLDVPNAVQDALDARFRVLERSRFPAEFNLGLVVTFYANRRGTSDSD